MAPVGPWQSKSLGQLETLVTEEEEAEVLGGWADGDDSSLLLMTQTGRILPALCRSGGRTAASGPSNLNTCWPRAPAPLSPFSSRTVSPSPAGTQGSSANTRRSLYEAPCYASVIKDRPFLTCFCPCSIKIKLFSFYSQSPDKS